MRQIAGLIAGIIGLGMFGLIMARLVSGRVVLDGNVVVYFSTYRAVYEPILAVLGIGIALAMFFRWRKARRRINAP